MNEDTQKNTDLCPAAARLIKECKSLTEKGAVWLCVLGQRPTISVMKQAPANFDAVLCQTLTCPEDASERFQQLALWILQRYGEDESHIPALRLVVLPFELGSATQSSWGLALSTLAATQSKLKQQALCISTLGGAYSALGDINKNHAVKAQEMAISQMTVARAMGNDGLYVFFQLYLYLCVSFIQVDCLICVPLAGEVLIMYIRRHREARCVLFVAWAMIQQERVNEADTIITSLEIRAGFRGGQVGTSSAWNAAVPSHASRALREDQQLQGMIAAARRKLSSGSDGQT